MVPMHCGELCRQSEPRGNSYPIEFTLHQGDCFSDQIVRIKQRPGLFLTREDLPHRLDYFAGAIAVRRDVLETSTRFTEIGRSPIQPAQAGVGTCDDRAERLL